MLLTNLKGNVLQLEGRISNQILEELLIFFTGISGEIYVPKAFQPTCLEGSYKGLEQWIPTILLQQHFQQYYFDNITDICRALRVGFSFYD